MNTEFWMPAPDADRYEWVADNFVPLNRRDAALLRRLTHGKPPRKRSRHAPMRDRAAMRRRRRMLERLGIQDIRRLMQLMTTLGL